MNEDHLYYQAEPSSSVPGLERSIGSPESSLARKLQWASLMWGLMEESTA